jgi:hypothetical protein
VGVSPSFACGLRNAKGLRVRTAWAVASTIVQILGISIAVEGEAESEIARISATFDVGTSIACCGPVNDDCRSRVATADAG